MNKAVQRIVVRERPEFGLADRYPYFKPAQHVIGGFLIERGSGGYYVWKYIHPLYDRFEFFSLLFGDRLPGEDGFIRGEGLTPRELASAFLARISPFEEAVRASCTPQALIAHIERMGTRVLENPWVRRAYALSLIMVGAETPARQQLAEVLESGSDYVTDLDLLNTQLTRGVLAARAVLLEWESETRRRFNLT